MKKLLWGVALWPLLVTYQSWAAPADLTAIQYQWAICQYQLQKDEAREDCFEQLIDTNKAALAAAPERQDLRVWLGINLSSLAGVKGGLGALSLVKQARKEFEQVIATAPDTLHGSAYVSLGALYYQVPGWPIGFGSDKKAKALLKQGLAIDPNGIDANYFYADFLRDQGDIAAARSYFERALAAAPRLDRPLADKGRRAEVAAKLKEL